MIKQIRISNPSFLENYVDGNILETANKESINLGRFNTFINKTKEILEEKLIHIAKNIGIEDYNIEIDMNGILDNGKVSCFISYSLFDLNNHKIGSIYTNENLDFGNLPVNYKIDREVFLGDNQEYFNGLNNIDSSSFFLDINYYELNKHLPTRNYSESDYNICDYTVKSEMKDRFNNDLNELLESLENNKLYNFSGIYAFGSAFTISKDTTVLLRFRNKERSFISPKIEINYESKDEFNNLMLNTFVNMGMLEKDVLQKNNISIENAFSAHKIERF